MAPRLDDVPQATAAPEPAGVGSPKSDTKDAKAPDQAPPDTADSLKEKGNQAVRAERYTEAVLHYSFAIKLSPNDAILYSNRSLAFLKLQQLYYANEDAERAIQLRPDWAKGYFRKAEVHAAAEQYDTSLLSYGRALQLQPSDASILTAAKRVAALSARQGEYEKRLPWAGAGCGIVLGVIIVLADQLFTKAPSFSHPSLMVLLVMVVSGIGYAVATAIRYYSRLQKRSMLEPPVELLDDFKKDDGGKDAAADDELPANRNRYSKAQARQRFRKGKS